MQKSYMQNNANSKIKVSLGQYILAIFCFFTLLISLSLMLLSAEGSGIAEFGFILLLGALVGLCSFNQKTDIEE